MCDNRPSWEKFTAKEWALALQDLTPGGSEFLTPAECTAWIRRRTEYPRMIIELREDNARLRNSLAEVLDTFKNEFEDDIPELGAAIREVLSIKGGVSK